jgi:hypothetical protein
MAEFILMLTCDDRTIERAGDIYNEVRDTGIRYDGDVNTLVRTVVQAASVPVIAMRKDKKIICQSILVLSVAPRKGPLFVTRLSALKAQKCSVGTLIPK